MKKIVDFMKYYHYYNKRMKEIDKIGIKNFLSQKKYVNQNTLSLQKTNETIYDMINSGKPFLVGRFGGNELSMLKTIEFDVKSSMDKCIELLCNNAGFFPKEAFDARRYQSEMMEFCKNCDILGVWFRPFEDYYIKKYMKPDLHLTYLQNIEPWTYTDKPWSAALKGKKILIIHPFEESIKKQYRHRADIFQGTDILPEFELKTLKAVQTAAGAEDTRFNNWFEALEYMFSEAMKIDFDIAIIGCGAYGAPLAARIKAAGKQAVHLGGPTQIMFGIRGRRWDESPIFDYVRKFYNDSWIYPGTEEKPQGAKKIENACYW
jgi:hypothetical protein